MAYNDVAEMKDSTSLRRRLHASAAQESKPNVEEWVTVRIWNIVGAPGWGAAWASARANGNNDPGSDEGVITDGMILAVIQPMQ